MAAETAEFLRALERVPDDFMQHPYEILADFRARGRVHHVLFPTGAATWLVTRYDDVRALLSDPRVSKDGRRMNELFARHSGITNGDDSEKGDVGFDDDLSWHMLNSDPPEHTRLRGLVSKALTPRQIEAYRPRVASLVDDLLEPLEGRDDIDLVREFAMPLVLINICDLLGIPSNDREAFRQWAVDLVGAGHDPQVVESASRGVVEYANAAIEAKRADPGDDMVSWMLRGGDEDGQDRLAKGEIAKMIFLFTVAGHITSQHAICNAIYSLLTHPGELATLRADLSLMPIAIDELLRYDGGVGIGTFRFTTADIEIGDVVIPAGEILALSVESAHRDASRYPDPDRLDLTRHPLGVLGFGHGTHYCIGQSLAKIQLDLALTKIITRFPHLRLAVDPSEVKWESSPLLRGPVALPVAVTPPENA